MMDLALRCRFAGVAFFEFLEFFFIAWVDENV